MNSSIISGQPANQPRTEDPVQSQSFYLASPRFVLLMILVLLLAAALRFYDLGSESFSYDEGIMIEATSSGWETVVANIVRGRPPLIVLVGFGWIQLVGESELAVRLLPAVMGILSVFLLMRIGKTLFNDYVGLIAGVVMAMSAFHLFHSQDYRYYSLLTLMTLSSVYLYIQSFGSVWARTPNAIKERSQGMQAESANGASLRGNTDWWPLLLYVFFSALVYYAHYQGIFVLVAQGLFFLTMWFRATNQLRIRWFISQVAIVLLLLPSVLRVLLDFTAGSDDGNYQGTIGALGNLGPLSEPELWLPFHTILVKYLFISTGNLLQWPYLLAGGGLIAVGVLVSLLNNQWNLPALVKQTVIGEHEANPSLYDRTRWLFLILWISCPIFIPFIVSIIVSPMYLPRYTISALPAVCLVIAALLFWVRKFVPLWATIGSLLILSIPGLTTYYTKDYKDQWRIAAEYVDAQMATEHSQGNQARFAFVSVNNETADRIEKLFGRYLDSSSLASSSLATPSAAQSNFVNQSTTIDTTCTISAGLTAPVELPQAFQACFAEFRSAEVSTAQSIAAETTEDRLWLITRVAKEGPQLTIEEQVLAAIDETIPKEWQQIEEKRFSGVIVRLYGTP